MLVTAARSRLCDGPADYGDAAWLARRHAITVLPSVASLKALRQFAKTSKATRPYRWLRQSAADGPSGADKRAWRETELRRNIRPSCSGSRAAQRARLATCSLRAAAWPTWS